MLQSKTRQANVENHPHDATFYEFREANTVTELMKLLLLRAEAYAASPYATGVEFSPEGLELDEFDLRSRHFGLFAERRHPVGYLRVIHAGESIVEPRLRQIVEGCSALEQRIERTPATDIPLLGYTTGLSEDESLQRAFARARTAGRVVEASRLAVSPASRDRLLSRHIVEGACAIYYEIEPASAFLGCDARQARLYRAFGFTHACENPRRIDIPRWGCPFALLVGNQADVRDPYRTRLHDLATEFRARHHIRFETSSALHRRDAA